MNIAMGETRPTRLARNLGVTRQAISQLLAQMSARGLVVTRQDLTDGRARVVEFAPRAERVRDVAIGILVQLEEVLGERIGVAQIEAMRGALESDWGDPKSAFRMAPPPKSRVR
jgi:DNA-binding MarR family transcriptional regulator